MHASHYYYRACSVSTSACEYFRNICACIYHLQVCMQGTRVLPYAWAISMHVCKVRIHVCALQYIYCMVIYICICIDICISVLWFVYVLVMYLHVYVYLYICAWVCMICSSCQECWYCNATVWPLWAPRNKRDHVRHLLCTMKPQRHQCMCLCANIHFGHTHVFATMHAREQSKDGGVNGHHCQNPYNILIQGWWCRGTPESI